ncbi:MAG: carboxypeptidase regulatory-like domain-containing protein [Vicinamibacterales bacterium]
MRSALLAVALVLALAVPAVAQLQSGNIYGTVRDAQAAVLPGATVTLTGPGPSRTFTTDETGEFRFLNVAPGTYRLRVELPGFATFVNESVVVTVGSNTDLPIQMKLAGLAESLTVTSESPIVDTKSMGTSTNFTRAELHSIPTSRDPWALLRTVPGVQMDRVNIAGNETGQQSNFNSKGSARSDTVWTMDGVIITDMSATGASPTYFDFDAFDEIQISTAGQDIRQPTGGAGLNFVVKRGTNSFSGTARGYFTNDKLEGSNLPDELAARGVTPASADHNDQISEYGFDIGGPIWRDRAWFWGSIAQQDIRLVRSAGNIVDKTVLKTYNVKGNWQATSKDNISVLWFLGAKEKFGRFTGDAQVLAPTSTWNQGNLYPDNRPSGLLKFEDNRVFTNSLFVVGKYAYYGTGFSLEPAGGLDGQASISERLGRTFGTTRALRFLRPQHTVAVDANHFRNAWGFGHDIKFGGGYRRHDATAQTLWPGNMILALDNSATDQRARLYREGAGTDRTEYFSLYLGDTITRGPITMDLGLRYDRQWGAALPSNTMSNAAFPDLVPGIRFAGYRSPFTWNTVHPRLGVTYALDESRKTILRANFSRYAGQLDASIVGWSNPSASVGFVEYPWTDLNSDNFVQPEEVVLSQGFLQPGGGFNPDDPTSVVSADVIDPNLEAPVSTGVVVGIDRELMPNLGLQVNYSYGRSRNHVNLTGASDPFGQTFIPWIGVGPGDYLPGPLATGVLPDGSPYSIPTFIPDEAVVAANGNGRLLTNYQGYYTTYHGLELSVVKRMSNRWMMRAGVAYNNPREFFDDAPRNYLGNPTRTESSPLVQGGQVAVRSSGSGAGDVFVNGKWQLNINGAYMLPYNFEVAGNLFGRQGNAFPVFQAVALGLDGSTRVLVSPEVDTFRFDDIWNLDLRVSKDFTVHRFRAQLIADLFNVLNSNTELNRQRNIQSPNFNVLTQNLSPRIVRFGLRIGF